MHQLGVFIFLSSLIVIHCFDKKQEHNDKEWKSKLKDLHSKINGSSKTPSEPKEPGILQCAYYSHHVCWPNEMYCSNVLDGGSCACIVNQSYKVINLNETTPITLCPIGWNSTPYWILFFASIGFIVLALLIFQAIRYSWPTISSTAQPALVKVKDFSVRQWQQQRTQRAPSPQSFLMQTFNDPTTNACFTLED